MVNDIPSLTNGSAITMLCFLLLLYSPSAILFNTCLSYIFDKMDSAQSIMPNITTWVGVIPFILVAVLDTFKWGEYFIISTNHFIIDSKLLLLIFYINSRFQHSVLSPPSVQFSRRYVHTLRHHILC